MQNLLARHSSAAFAPCCQVKRRGVAAAAKKGFGAAESKQLPKVTEPTAAAAAAAAAPPPESPVTPAAAAQSSAAAGAASHAAALADQTRADTSSDKEEAIEAILRKRKGKKGKVEAKVKVESAVVDMATGKAPANAVGEAETKVIQMLLGFFGILLTEGLVLAGSGFFEPDVDAWVQDVLYPSYTPQMLLFLGMSSAYGLWKTGKLPFQSQQK